MLLTAGINTLYQYGMTQLEICTEKIRELVRKDGYIYAFLMTVVRDCFYDVYNPAEYEARDKLITEELMTILGFWIQSAPNLFSYPSSFEALYSMMIEADNVMHDMHLASAEKVFGELKTMMQNPVGGSRRELSDKAKAEGIHEAIYYGADPAYDYEYLHFLPKKYKYDKEWLIKNKHFDPDEAVSIAITIKELLRKKVSVLQFPDRTLDFKQFGYAREDDFKMALEFYTYRDIIPDFEEDADDKTIENSLHSFCNSMLELFSIDSKDLGGHAGGNEFLDNFSIVISRGCNSEYHRFGDYNVLQATPIIRMDNGKYFIPLIYQVFVSMYETPFYWIMADEHYRKTAGSHRGLAGEDMAFEVLEPVFGKERLFRDIEIKDSKHHTITDIDALCILGSKAICIQVKSKRLSQASRNGSIEQLTKDFKGAVQDAYEQGVNCRKHLLNQSGVFFWSKDSQSKVNIPRCIDEVYIICLTSENYPALTHQVHELLLIQSGNPHPLVLSVFDLRLISHYLDNPYKFTYYVRQRIKTCTYFYSDNEMNYLAYHLLHKLYPNPDYNHEYLDHDFACEIDKDYYPFISGRSDSLDKGTLKNKWENKRFDLLCDSTANVNSPKSVDIIFFLYDLSSDSRDKLIEALDYVKKRSKENSTIVNVRAQFDSPEEITGITCVAVQPYADLYKDLFCLAEMHKYYHKGNKWLALGVYNNSPSMVDMALYEDNVWEEDPVLAKICKENLTNTGQMKL